MDLAGTPSCDSPRAWAALQKAIADGWSESTRRGARISTCQIACGSRDLAKRLALIPGRRERVIPVFGGEKRDTLMR